MALQILQSPFSAVSLFFFFLVFLLPESEVHGSIFFYLIHLN